MVYFGAIDFEGLNTITEEGVYQILKMALKEKVNEIRLGTRGTREFKYKKGTILKKETKTFGILLAFQVRNSLLINTPEYTDYNIKTGFSFLTGLITQSLKAYLNQKANTLEVSQIPVNFP